jgi:hypothetical protein
MTRNAVTTRGNCHGVVGRDRIGLALARTRQSFESRAFERFGHYMVLARGCGHTHARKNPNAMKKMCLSDPGPSVGSHGTRRESCPLGSGTAIVAHSLLAVDEVWWRV